ncbi:MAG: hypothetical protein LBC07_00075 [Elusimicrobiota bacterium]|jgi:hypothetical protein|nr:hypothetical protein [Elusimicrobiota bacterium]
MATDKIISKETVETLNNNYTPVYKQLLSIFNKQINYDEYVGSMTFLESKTIGDLTARRITTQDTEAKHIAVGQGKKVYVKDFYGVNYQVSGYQENSDAANITSRVLESLSKQQDEFVFTGNPSASGVLENNGIIGTTDPNVIKNPDLILSNVNIDTVIDFFVTLVNQSETIAGNSEKTILIGGPLKRLLSKVVPSTSTLYKTIIGQAFNIPVNLVAIPSNLEQFLPAEKSLAQVLTLDNIILRHSAMPRLKSSGYNAENDYTWYKFFFGAAMVDVEQLGASIIQYVAIA